MNSFRSLSFASAGLVLMVTGGLAGWMWQSKSVAATTPAEAASRAEIERTVHDYILNHPEILPEAMERLRAREARKQLAGVADQVEMPFPGAVLGNPQGKVTLVEFTDFACTFCRRSVADVEAVIAANPDLRVVVRELPILTPASGDAARMALAAAEQGRYAAFHKAMWQAGRPDAQTIAAAARAAGLDMARAGRVIADPRIDGEIAHNLDLARQLGFDGTPSWVVGEQILSGAVGENELAKAVTAARG
ncbi:MAG TPA: DsbA family protein [Novosphingobium sp.]|nr:DsbA family protein [Novosphingobium sp.]